MRSSEDESVADGESEEKDFNGNVAEGNIVTNVRSFGILNIEMDLFSSVSSMTFIPRRCGLEAFSSQCEDTVTLEMGLE